LINVGHGAAIAKKRIIRTPVAQVLRSRLAHHGPHPILTSTQSSEAVDDLSALVDGVERAGLGPDLAGRNWPNKTSQPRSSALPASQTNYIAIAPGIGVFDPLRHYGRFTRPPGEVAGPPIGDGYSAQAAPMLVRALHRQTIPLMPQLLCAAFAPLHAASTTAKCPRRKMYYPTSLVRRFEAPRKRNKS
jgi:hypothetical protein